MQAIGKYIVIKKITEEVKSSSGLIMDSETKSVIRYNKGVVVNVGLEVKGIKEEDVIYYDKNAGHTLLLGGDKNTIIQERDVVVIL